MKKLEFESNGSKWFLADLNSDQGLYDLQDELGYCLEKSEKYFYVKDITEEQASEVVDWDDEKQFYYKYPHTDWQGDISAIDSLNSLLKSKGVYLYKNPNGCSYRRGFDGGSDYRSFLSWHEAESKTFYNPVLFKILK